MAGDFERLCGLRAAQWPLPGRGLVCVRGRDRVRFLDGMLTNHVAPLAPGASCYALLLDRKGRIQADLFVLVLDDVHLLDSSPDTGGRVVEALARHLVADDVALEDRSGDWCEIGFEGPEAAGAVRRAGGRAPAAGRVEWEACDGGLRVWLGGGSLGVEGVRLLGPAAAVRDLAAATGLPELSRESAEIVRVERALPAWGVELTERTFPQEARLDHALARRKGCYVGQEIVARIDSRGAVHRRLVKLRAAAAVAPGAPVCLGAAEVGRVTSAVLSPLGGPTALGYVRVDCAAAGTPLRIDGVEARVVEPPL